MRDPHDVEARLRDLEAAPPRGFAERVVARVHETLDRYVAVDTPVERLFVAFNDAGIRSVVAASAVADDELRFEQAHEARFGRRPAPAMRPPAGLAEALRTGSGRRLRYDLRDASPFQRAVLDKALEIPRGEVRSYSWIAREIGRPAAVRAVGTALARNPVPVLIPCHRVLRRGGDVGDYAFGSAMKTALLEHERVDLPRLRSLARRGVRFTGSDTTRIFCEPTCHNARRTTSAHEVVFADAATARVAGFRPCRVCRPAP